MTNETAESAGTLYGRPKKRVVLEHAYAALFIEGKHRECMDAAKVFEKAGYEPNDVKVVIQHLRRISGENIRKGCQNVDAAWREMVKELKHEENRRASDYVFGKEGT